MSSLEKFNFDGHRDNCRCCMRRFDGEDDLQIKVTETVQGRFLELTQLELEVGDSYSSVICERCYNELRSFSSWRKELVRKQLCLQEYEKDLKIAEEHRELSGLNASAKVFQEPTEHEDDATGSAEFKLDINDKPSTSPAQAEARTSKMLRNQESKILDGQSEATLSLSAHGSNEREAQMAQNELVVDSENDSFEKAQKPVPRKRGRPRKGTESELQGKPVTLGGKKFVCNEAVHLKIKRFECDICGLKYYYKNSLKRHMRRHIEGKPLESALNYWNCYDNTRPFSCRVKNCKKFFKTNRELLQHSITHSDKRPHVCYCGIAFKRPQHLKSHQRTQHTER